MTGNLVQGAVFTVMVVRAGMLRDPGFEAELAEQVQRSPRFFHNAPVVLDLKGVEEFAREAEFAEAKEILRRHTLTLIGIQNAAPTGRLRTKPCIYGFRQKRALMLWESRL